VILVDTTIWVDHLRDIDNGLAHLLASEQVLGHPFVLGELALGRIPRLELVLKSLADLPRATIAADAEVLEMISRNSLIGLGIGYIDAHLLAAVRLTPGAGFWTRDRRLASAARHLGIASPKFS
jgi:predicted nucleic acid-binding protein